MLARDLGGMTVTELSARLEYAEYVRWAGLYQLEGHERAEAERRARRRR